MKKANSFFVEFETKPDEHRNPFNYNQVIERKFTSCDDTIKVSNCLVTITLHKDGRFEVEPNTRNVDEEKLLKRVS